MTITYSNTNHSTRYHEGATPYISFPQIGAYSFIKEGFSTRFGGVSSGIYESMSLTFSRGDNPDHVLENFRRMGQALSIPVESMILSDQTHTTNVRQVGARECGMGILRERNFHDVDGLITDEPGVCLVTSYADCVPLFFVDPVRRAIGASHSGWRGTVGNIAAVTVTSMQNAFGSNPSDLIAFIGPSICRNCYEVGEDVAECFAKAYGPSVFDGILAPKQDGKFLLNLWRANGVNLLAAGLAQEHIGITDLCTCCNASLLHSHRATKGERGGNCGFVMITDSMS